jgi:LCP family protein required for cell wall assembly
VSRHLHYLLLIGCLAGCLAVGAFVHSLWSSNAGLTTFEPHEAVEAVDAYHDPVAWPVATPPAPDTRSGVTSYLLFTVGSVGVSDDQARELGVPTGRGADLLTDTVMLVRVSERTGEIDLVSLPRDLWFPELGAKLSEIYPRHGLSTMVASVEELTGVKVDRRVRLSMPGFVTLIDQLGGVTVPTTTPVRDRGSHLALPAGTHRLDGATALAYARSRKLEVLGDDGVWRYDISASDIGRTQRQQQIAASLVRELATPATVTKVPVLYRTVAEHLVVDAEMTVSEAARVALALTSNGAHLTSATLPVVDGREGRKWVVYPTVDVPVWFAQRPLGAELRVLDSGAEAGADAQG